MTDTQTDNRARNTAAIRLEKEENVQELQALANSIVGLYHPMHSQIPPRLTHTVQLASYYRIEKNRVLLCLLRRRVIKTQALPRHGPHAHRHLLDRHAPRD